MQKLIHTLCVMICVAFIGAMTTHGASDLRHDFSHAASSQDDGIGHGHDDLHDDAGEAQAAPADVEALSGALPSGHHHHSGGDNHAALLDHQGGLPGLVSARSFATGLGVGQHPDGFLSDAPEQPPKQLRLIA